MHEATDTPILSPLKQLSNPQERMPTMVESNATTISPLTQQPVMVNTQILPTKVQKCPDDIVTLQSTQPISKTFLINADNTSFYQTTDRAASLERTF